MRQHHKKAALNNSPLCLTVWLFLESRTCQYLLFYVPISETDHRVVLRIPTSFVNYKNSNLFFFLLLDLIEQIETGWLICLHLVSQ